MSASFTIALADCQSQTGDKCFLRSVDEKGLRRKSATMEWDLMMISYMLLY